MRAGWPFMLCTETSRLATWSNPVRRRRVLLGEDEALPAEPGIRDAISPPPVARSRP
jgi:hypothetical protein